MLCCYAGLDKEKLDELQKLEKKLGKTLLAFQCHDTKMEKLNQTEMSEIQELEKRLGFQLVAVQK
ncbi:MAG: hypothetical protein M0Z48_12395 [Nitrospiraceae bacterium]|nr:hypothetical protein [Nitrospiraceae bacterium]